jgi:hypothetical protein
MSTLPFKGDQPPEIMATRVMGMKTHWLGVPGEARTLKEGEKAPAPTYRDQVENFLWYQAVPNSDGTFSIQERNWTEPQDTDAAHATYKFENISPEQGTAWPINMQKYSRADALKVLAMLENDQLAAMTKSPDNQWAGHVPGTITVSGTEAPAPAPVTAETEVAPDAP